MTWPRYSTKPACKWCLDFRVREASAHELQPCPECGGLNEVEYAAYRKKRHREMSPLPEITQLDLTEEEFADYQSLSKAHPGTSGVTVLSWMEGRRYNPAKDPVFLAECEEEMEKWRNERRAEAELIGRTWDAGPHD